MNKFKKLYNILMESTNSNPPLTKLTQLGQGILEYNWNKVKFKCNLTYSYYHSDTKQSEKGKYKLKLKAHVKKQNNRSYQYVLMDGPYFYNDEQVSIFSDEISMHPIELMIENKSYHRCDSNLISAVYDQTTKTSTLTYKVHTQLRYQLYITGTISLILPGFNIINPKPAVKIDVAKANEFIKSHIPKKWWCGEEGESYDDLVDFVDQIDCSMEGDTFKIKMRRATIKAYGDGYYYSDDYKYIAHNGLYNEDGKRYGMGAGYVHKQNSEALYLLKTALQDFVWKNYGSAYLPEHLIITICGEAD